MTREETFDQIKQEGADRAVVTFSTDGTRLELGTVHLESQGRLVDVLCETAQLNELRVALASPLKDVSALSESRGWITWDVATETVELDRHVHIWGRDIQLV